MGDFKAAFYKGTRPGMAGIYNRLVRWIGRGPYSHCELIFSDGLAASASWMDGGVRFKRIEFDPEHWDFIGLDPDKESTARLWFAEHDGQGYDLMGNLRFLCGIVRESTDRWYCNEALGASLGMPDPWRLEPNGLAVFLKEQVRGNR